MSLKVWFCGYLHKCAFWTFIISFIGKVKRGEVVSSRQNSKVKTGKDWSSFQHHYFERCGPSLKGSYPFFSYTHGKHCAAFGVKAKRWDPHPNLAFAKAFRKAVPVNKGMYHAMRGQALSDAFPVYRV